MEDRATKIDAELAIHIGELSQSRLDSCSGEDESEYQPGRNGAPSREKHRTLARPQVEFQRGVEPNYKPTPLKWPFIVILLFLILSLIGLTGYACHVLPVEEDNGAIGGIPTASTTSSAMSSSSLLARRSRRRDEDSSFGGQNSATTRMVQEGSTAGRNSPRTVTSRSQPSTTTRTIEEEEPRTIFAATKRPTFSPKVPSSAHASGKSTDPGDWAVDGEVTITSAAGAAAPSSSAPNYGRPVCEDDGSAGGNNGNRTTSTTGLQTVEVYIPVGGVTATSLLEGGATSMVPVEDHASVGAVTAVNKVVVTSVVGVTTLKGVSSTIVETEVRNGVTTSLLTRTTTVRNGIVSSFTSVITLSSDNIVSTVLPVYVTASVETLTNSLGVPTSTVTSIPPAISTTMVVVLHDSNGVPTETATSLVLATPITTVLTNWVGVPTATLMEYPTYPSSSATTATGPHSQTVITAVYYISKLEYFIGYFLPPLVSVCLAILVRILDLNAKQFQPFHELTHPDGTLAHESLCLQTSGLHGVWASVRSLFGGRALVFVTTLLVLCSAFLVPLSSEAVALKLHGTCTINSFRGCAMTLGIFLTPARATMGLLGGMAVLVIVVFLLLRGWRSGVAANPWSIAGMASLSTNDEVRALLRCLPLGEDRIRGEALSEVFDGRKFKLGLFSNKHGLQEYGIVVCNTGGLPPQKRDSLVSTCSQDRGAGIVTRQSRRKHHLPFLMLSYTSRIMFVAFLCGLLAVILYYNNTGGDTPFENFMDEQSFGVRFLFTAVGIGITFFWSSFFTSVATLSPYCLLSSSPKHARRSILLSPPTHALTGLWSAVRRRHFFLVTVALTAIGAEFMPILLNNVPFRLTQTWLTHMVCTWLAVGMAGIMLLVVTASFFIRWPHMPVDPSTIAGAMFYVCDSRMLWEFEETSMLDGKDRDRRLSEMGVRYGFGDIVGASGVDRVGVDAVDGDLKSL